MGEPSVVNGQKGEKIVDELLNLIGWKSTPINESLPCIYPEKHKDKYRKKGKSTHGKDSFYCYRSPFFTGQLDHIIISSKFTDKPYPNSPNSKFKEHFIDLAHTIECYMKSSLKNQNSNFKNIDYIEIYGILFWTSNDTKYLTESILSKLNPIFSKDLDYKIIYLIDSARSEFIFNSIKVIENSYTKNGYISNFYYIDTGNNPSDRNKKYNGIELPIQSLISDIQLFRLEKNDEIILVIIIKDTFSVESLARILGLAHNLGKGLAKINIHFPDYITSKHENDVKRVKRTFDTSNIVDSINILSYNNDFRSLANNNHTDYLPVKNDENIELDYNQILPYGNELRDLLSRSQISVSEMNKLLKTKGVYIAEPSKENILPLLSSILLSPQEFDFLKESQKNNEDKEKLRSNPPITCMETIKNKNLITILPSSLNLNEIAKKPFSNYEFHNAMLSFEMIEQNPNKIKASYKITKYENNKIWFENKNEFYGYIIFELNQDNLEIKSASIHTSNETKEIIDSIKKEVLKILKNKKFIDENTIEEKILIENFSNEERITFFLSFTDTLIPELIFESVISMDIELDDSKTLPHNNIKLMDENIKKLKIEGKSIQDIEIIKNLNNRKYFKSWSMTAEYKLDSKEGKGRCKINFSFQKTGNNEFEIHIDGNIKLEKLITSKKSAEKFILNAIDNLKLKNYQEIMEKKNV